MITSKQFAAAKRAAKKMIADATAAHRAAIDSLRASNPTASDELIGGMAWQCVLAARSEVK